MAKRCEDWERWDITPGSFLLSHPEDGDGGGWGSQPYQQDSTQLSNHWVPETAGGREWMGEQHQKEGKDERKKANFYTAQVTSNDSCFYSSVCYREEILLGRRDTCTVCPTACCQWWSISICNTCLLATAAGSIWNASLREGGVQKAQVCRVLVIALKHLQINVLLLSWMRILLVFSLSPISSTLRVFACK